MKMPSPSDFVPTLQTHEALERYFQAHPVCRQLCIAPTLITPHWVDFKLANARGLLDACKRVDSSIIAMTVEVAATLLASVAVKAPRQWHVAATQLDHEPPSPDSHGPLRVSASLDEMQTPWSQAGEKKVLVAVTTVETGLPRACAFVYIEVR